MENLEAYKKILQNYDLFISQGYCSCCKEYIPEKYKFIHPRMDFHKRKHIKTVKKIMRFNNQMYAK